jgi:hypothetical protein
MKETRVTYLRQNRRSLNTVKDACSGTNSTYSTAEGQHVFLPILQTTRHHTETLAASQSLVLNS